MHTFCVDDVVLNVYPCVHCGKDATEGEAQAAVARYRDLMGLASCCVCAQPILIPSYDIEHIMGDATSVGWFAYPTDGRSPVSLRIDRRRVSIGACLHEECARRAMPHLSEDFWKEMEWDPMWPDPWPSTVELRFPKPRGKSSH